MEDNPAVRKCPVCGKHTFKHPFEECPVCNWMNDVVQEEWYDAGGLGNHMSLKEARAAYAEGIEIY